MSQQTQVARVGAALPAFLARFPDVPTLAAATSADVIRAWGGLGYPRRALALRDAARAMVERHGGRVPGTVAELESLPGVGPYTARAVAAAAFGEPVTALDVNARRVLGRLIGGTGLPSLPSRAAQARADGLAPATQAADWNHALMDLGATVCRPLPDCPACPLRRWCAFASDGRTPTTTARRRPAAPFRATNRYVRGRVLGLLRDAPHGAWQELDPSVLAIAPERVERAVRELVADGLIELAEGPDQPPRARLSSG